MFRLYKKKEFAEMRLHVSGEDMKGITINLEDLNEVNGEGGGMISRNPKNHKDQWYVSKQFFQDNFDPI